MKKYNCNNTLDYAHEASRMCETFDNCSTRPCPLYGLSCEHFETTAEHIKIAQAIIIHEKFFPDIPIEELFKK